VTLTATITDVLPNHVTATQPAVWASQVITAPGGVWTETVVVTVEMGYAGPLTNVVHVATEEGATGVYTATALSLAPHLSVTKQASSDLVDAGERLTYTIRITNTGNVDLHATITDILPNHITAAQPVVWVSQVITAPGGIWTETVVVTVEIGYAGPLTNVVHVTTEEGATGVYTETSEAQVTPELIVAKQAGSDPVDAGEQLTYTIRVTNTGNVDLHATVTDVLPGRVTPTGVLTWPAVITAPDGVWERTVVVTVEMGYSGTLVNVVHVTTEEGAAGVYTATVLSLAPHVSVTKQASIDPVDAGGRLTYTIRVTNTGNVDLHATVTDVLPSHIIPTGVLTWPVVIAAPDGVWTERVVVTVEMGYAGPLTNVVRVATKEGATGVYTETSLSLAPLLSVTKQASSDRVDAGERLTYTIRITNTGNVDLHATVTDVLPSQVTPTGALTWPTVIAAPGDVWTKTVVVTVEEEADLGLLTNTVRVTTEEGVAGTAKSDVLVGYRACLPVVIRN
jgi:uncharacterized repeat protein (TIGR01451 family)